MYEIPDHPDIAYVMRTGEPFRYGAMLEWRGSFIDDRYEEEADHGTI